MSPQNRTDVENEREHEPTIYARQWASHSYDVKRHFRSRAGSGERGIRRPPFSEVSRLGGVGGCL